jgi:preprotein translocase subunit YajC
MRLKKWHKIVLVLIVLGAITAFFVWRWANKPNPNPKNDIPDYSLSAAALVKEFADNDSLAQLKYKDKLIEVSGIAKKIVPSDSATVINLGDSTSMSVVQCQVDARNNEDAMKVKEGGPVTVKGKLAGFSKQESGDAVGDLLGEVSTGTDVILNFCSIVNKK